MSRGASAGVLSAVADAAVRGVYFVQLDMAAGTIYACNATHNVVWNGQTWIGAGLVGTIEPITDGLSSDVRGIAMELSMVPLTLIAPALNADYFNRQCTIWFGVFDDGERVIVDPIIVFRGRMDTMPIAIGKTGTFKLTVESPDVDWNRPRTTRYTDAEQQAKFPGDRGLEFVASLIDKPVAWGR